MWVLGTQGFYRVTGGCKDLLDWINVRDPLYFWGVWDSVYLSKSPRLMWAKLNDSMGFRGDDLVSDLVFGRAPRVHIPSL